jgi:hypothetical protein
MLGAATLHGLLVYQSKWRVIPVFTSEFKPCWIVSLFVELGLAALHCDNVQLQSRCLYFLSLLRLSSS